MGFRCLAVLLALSPFLIAEIGLRIFLPASASLTESVDRAPLVDLHQLRPLFEPAVADGAAVMQIPAARRNFFQPASFPREKSTSSRRVFVVGGSTVQGRPYATETAFAKLLDIQLQATWPQYNWEVVNCGGVSYASYRVAAIVDEVLHYDPDLLIVYTGHNEFLEARTYATQRHVPRWLAPLLAAGSELRLVQAVASVTSGDPAPQAVLPSEVATRLDAPDGLSAFRRDDADRDAIARHFEVSLRRIVAACEAAGVPLLLCVPASQTRSVPPFKCESRATADAEERELWNQIQDAETSSTDRMVLAQRLLALDPQHAGAAFLQAQQLWENRQYDEAAKWFLLARDEDICPLRATSEMEQIVRRVAGDASVPLVDVPQLLADPKAAAICDSKAFVDHVHPAIHGGHTRIAAALLEGILARQMLGLGSPAVGDQAREALVVDYLSTIDEAYYHRGKQRLEGLRRWAAGRAAQPLEP